MLLVVVDDCGLQKEVRKKGMDIIYIASEFSNKFVKYLRIFLAYTVSPSALRVWNGENSAHAVMVGDGAHSP